MTSVQVDASRLFSESYGAELSPACWSSRSSLGCAATRGLGSALSGYQREHPRAVGFAPFPPSGPMRSGRVGWNAAWRS